MAGPNEAISCIKCKHYYITWDPNFPYGCRAMGFKGSKPPSVVVFQSSGRACLLFEGRPKKHQSQFQDDDA